jgi:hypothetical protein
MFLGVPDPDPLIRHGSGSRSGFGSGSFYHSVKIVRKTLIPICDTFDILSLKNDVNVPSKSN